jgi:hypothetical protein
MGNSLEKSACVSLENEVWLTAPSYTVERSSGEMDDDWVMSKPNVTSWIDKHAFKDENGIWRIFLHKNLLTGWRQVDKIKPMNFEGDIEAWRKKVIDMLEVLEVQRLNTITSDKKD